MDLIIIFFFIALIYSSIGFGGGSSYIALMLLFGLPFDHIPTVALSCNIIVVAGGAFYYIKNKQISFKEVLPYVLTSVPASYLAGTLHIPKASLKLILGLCLLLGSLRMLIKFNNYSKVKEFKTPSLFVTGFIGLLLGGISGLVGIGGGIFLSPIMYNFRWGSPRKIAAISCLFILFNSLFGLLGQLQKNSSVSITDDYWPLFLVVLAGGQLGSYLSFKKINSNVIHILTSFLILFVSLRVLFFTQ